jgi:hypothetical protein
MKKGQVLALAKTKKAGKCWFCPIIRFFAIFLSGYHREAVGKPKLMIELSRPFRTDAR